jgi:hypothetical protein
MSAPVNGGDQDMEDLTEDQMPDEPPSLSLSKSPTAFPNYDDEEEKLEIPHLLPSLVPTL